jgi:hypothetical protein
MFRGTQPAAVRKFLESAFTHIAVDAVQSKLAGRQARAHVGRAAKHTARWERDALKVAGAAFNVVSADVVGAAKSAAGTAATVHRRLTEQDVRKDATRPKPPQKRVTPSSPPQR